MIMRRRSRWLAAVSLAGLSLSAVAASAETLAEAISMAYASNPTLQAQRAQLRALDENWPPNIEEEEEEGIEIVKDSKKSNSSPF